MTWQEMTLRLRLAVAAGAIIGIERERKNRPAGMRTHVLVCVGAAMIAVIDSLNITETLEMNRVSDDTGIAISARRMSAQVISGIGFLGVGTILVSQKKIAGLTTAASLWCTACLYRSVIDIFTHAYHFNDHSFGYAFFYYPHLRIS